MIRHGGEDSPGWILADPPNDSTSTRWRTSSHSGNDSNCVEVRFAGRSVDVRDSKDRSGPLLSFSPSAFRAFVGGVAAH